MANKQKQRSSNQAQPTSAAPGGWFGRHLSRRAMGKGMAWTAILGMAGVTVYKAVEGGDSEVNYDSLELQKKEGWNVGAAEKTLFFPAGLMAVDSRQKSWGAYDPNYLISIFQPRAEEWQPFFVPTLLQSLAQPSLNAQIRPIHTNDMEDAYQRAEGLRNLISQSPNANRTLIVADLPGPASIAAGAALADIATLVPVFDNWPHPLGVVPAHETLGAMVYYAHEIEEKRGKLTAQAPAVMLLDSQRLSPYSDEDKQFDNRSLAKLPPAAQLKQRGIEQVIYLVKDQNQTTELDDINDDMVEWQKNGINVRLLKLSDFKPDDTQLASGGATATTGAVVHRHHYYGGSPYAHWWFYNHYAYRSPREVVVIRDGRNVSLPRPTSQPTFQPPNYRPVSRPTIFNASRIGGTSGIGKTKPSGFGRTSVRVSNTGRITGTRPGRSGSYGRSGGGWFGG